MGLSIRVGRVGIIACLQDGGAVKYAFEEQYKEFEKLTLDWAQFAEVTARIFYDLSRFNRIPKFILAEGNGHVQVMLNPLGGLSGKPLFEKGEMQDYFQVLAHCLRCPQEAIQPRPDKVMSWLYQSGKLKQMFPDDPA